MGQTSCKRWTVVESELRLPLRELKLLMEGIDFLPKLENLFFFLREVRFVGYSLEFSLHLKSISPI
jgi:hypothetical protein